MAITIGAGSDAWGIWHASHPAQIPWQHYLDEVSEAGYRVVEPGNFGYLPTDPAVTRRELAARGLHIPGGTLFGPIGDPAQHETLMKDLDATAGWLAAIGAEFLVALDVFYRDPDTGMPLGPRRLDPDGFARFVDALHAMARRAREAHGLALVFHPHCDATIEDEAEIERLLAATDPDLVGLCLDTGHHAYCGGDPVRFWHRHAARMPYIHFKSMNARVLDEVRRQDWPWGVAVARGVTEEPARGIVDFPALADAMRESAYHGYAIVEQDMFPCDPAVPLPLARRTIAYLKGLGFAT